MKNTSNHYFFKIHMVLLVLLCGAVCNAQAAKLINVSILDKDYLIVHLSDGEVIHHEGITGEEVITHPLLNTTEAVKSASWTITSAQDANYGGAGQNPQGCNRKKKLSGHAELGWSVPDDDYIYEYTYDHWIYLHLPTSLQQGMSYTLQIDSAVNSDTTSATVTFDIYNRVSEAVHVNLVGYAPDAPHKAADLYYWLGDGGARSYSSFENNTVYIYNEVNSQATPVGQVAFWMASGNDVFGRNLTRSDVWSVDFSTFTTPGTYRLVIEGVGCSQDFEIADDIYADPFKVSVRGYFYMRIGEDNPTMVPPPRTPLYIPGDNPGDPIVYLTTMHPYHPNWGSLTGGDNWDNSDAWAGYRKAGNPTNPNAWGGHSDAADWDRHLGHVVNIYDMLLPYILTNGALGDDQAGITESENGIPDIIDEARNEVDFWLRLRDGDGYSHGLTCPNSNKVFHQAGPTPIAAWANAANTAMLADAFRIAGQASLMNQYRDAAITAYSHANGLADTMLDEGIELDDGVLRGRDLKMMAAAFLYNVTGDQAWENVINDESVCASGPATILSDTSNQIFGTLAYLITPQIVNFPTLQANMKTQIINEATSLEAGRIDSRPSRRATDNRYGPAYWRPAHVMDRTIIAHAVTTNPAEKALFRKALNLEADWGLGRNPMNMIQMTTAFAPPLDSKRSVTEAYTSGRDDGVAGVHPGHTPYMNIDVWSGVGHMTMAHPERLYENSYPGNFTSTWPISEGCFPSRWVWAHSEFTPRQTMRGKMALYGYLNGIASVEPPANPTLAVSIAGIEGGSGAVTSSPSGINCGSDCSENYANGTEVILTAAPASGSNFAGWGGACFGNDDTCELTMSFNRSVTATFVPEGLTYNLTVTKSGTGNGTVTSNPVGIDCGGDCGEPYPYNSPVTLTALADGNATFSGWEGACSGMGACEVAMNADRSVMATFRSNNPPTVVIYDDALANGWDNWSWDAAIDFAGTSPVKVGTHAANVTLGDWSGFSPAMSSGSIDTAGYSALKFWIHGGTESDQVLSVYTQDENGNQSTHVDITAVAESWNEFTVTLDDLGNPPQIRRVNFANDSASFFSMITFDEIRLVPAVADPLPGDVNNDGEIDLEDLIVTLQVLVDATDAAHQSADVNGDGKIGVAESIYILQDVAGIRD